MKVLLGLVMLMLSQTTTSTEPTIQINKEANQKPKFAEIIQKVNPNLSETEIKEISKALEMNNPKETGLQTTELLALCIVESNLNPKAYSQENYGLSQINKSMYTLMVKAGIIENQWHLIYTIKHNIETAIQVLILAKQAVDKLHRKQSAKFKKKAILAIYNRGLTSYMLNGMNTYPDKVMRIHNKINGE